MYSPLKGSNGAASGAPAIAVEVKHKARIVGAIYFIVKIPCKLSKRCLPFFEDSKSMNLNEWIV
jgi:hypothetical protein